MLAINVAKVTAFARKMPKRRKLTKLKIICIDFPKFKMRDDTKRRGKFIKADKFLSNPRVQI